MEVKKHTSKGAEALLAEAAAIDGAAENLHPSGADLQSQGADSGAQQPGAEASPPAATLEQELTALAAMIGTTLAQFFPSTKSVLTEQKAAEIGGALAPLVQKYGLERHFMGFAWRVELQAAIVIVPVALAMREAIRQDLEQLRREARPPTAPPAGAGLGESPPPAGPSSPPRKPPGPGELVRVS